MFRKLTTGYQKFYSFLFGQESEHIHTREERKHYYGRIISDNVENTKMIHQYPIQGKFRFPIIDDEKAVDARSPIKKDYRESKEQQSQKQTSGRKSRSSENVIPTEKQPFKERKKFQGVNFKARIIPSPIYAYGKPPIKKKVIISEEQLMELESTTKIVLAEQPSVVVEKEEKFDDIIASEIPFLEKEVEVESKYEKDPVINEVSTISRILETALAEAEVAATRQAEAVIFEEEGETKEDSIGNNLEEVDGDTLIVKSLPVLVEEPREVLSEDDHLHSKETQEFEHPVTLVNTIKSEVKSNEQDAPQKTAMPYNVLMFQKDRVAHKKSQEKQLKNYQFPTIQLLNIPPKQPDNSQQWLDEKREILVRTLKNFNVQAKIVGVTKGPSVTRFEIQPEPGVKVSKVTSLIDDIKLSLAAIDIRMEAPIPGKNAIGIEVPNDISEPVVIREILRSREFQNNPSPLTVAMGLDIEGKPIVTDIQKMPHGLIAGSTGSGKSVCINSIIISLMFKATPDEVKLMLIDPKMVELAPYNDIPHLVTPVITDAKQATIALKWAVEEMDRRYELLVQNGVRDIKRYNEVMKKVDDPTPAMPYIVIIIDELADLMMVSPHDVEEAICRIAQKARACGIHLLLATQRPSVDVITGLIKANIPTRIAFSVSSQVDSRTIIDSGGAERLLGKGDMLLFENGASKPVRVQGNFVSDDEIDRVITLVKEQRKPNYLFDKEHLIKTYQAIVDEDELFEEACYYVLEQGGASSSSLQRKFRIGFNRAARLIEMMETKNIISEAMGSKPRNVLVSEQELSEQILN